MKVCSRCHNCFDDAPASCPLDAAALRLEFSGPPFLDEKYRLEKKIGSGGMGSVYLATHLGLNRQFALKTIETRHGLSPVLAARFEREATILGQLKHPNIVQVTDFGKDKHREGLLYLVMEILEGRTLHELVSGNPLEPESALPILQQIAEGLDYAHAKGFLHRDLKSGNVILTTNKSGQLVPMILDFGLARLITGAPLDSDRSPGIKMVDPGHSPDVPEQHTRRLNDEDLSLTDIVDSDDIHTFTIDKGSASVDLGGSLTSAGQIMGTPAYMSPEQIQGEVLSASSDLYAFGVMAYEMMIGQTPFRGKSAQILYQHMEAAPPDPTKLREGFPPGLGKALLLPLAKKASARPQSANEIVRLLKTALQNDREKEWTRAEQKPRWILSVATGVLLATLAVFFGYLGPLQLLESRIVQLWFRLLPMEKPSPEIVLVSIDEASVRNQAPLSEWGDEFGTSLSDFFQSGALAVAVDVIPHENWSQSETLQQSILAHADKLLFAALSGKDGVTGPEFAQGFLALALGPQKAQELFAYVNLDIDEDGVTRKMQLYHMASGKRRIDSFPMRAAKMVAAMPIEAEHQSEWISLSLDDASIPRISWKNRKSTDPEFYRNKLILVGIEYTGAGDIHRIPVRGSGTRDVTGLTLNAIMADTALKQFPFRESKRNSMIVAFAFTLLLGAALSMSLLWFASPARSVPVIGVAFLLPFVVSFIAIKTSGQILPSATIALSSLLAAPAALLMRKRLAPRP